MGKPTFMRGFCVFGNEIFFIAVSMQLAVGVPTKSPFCSYEVTDCIAVLIIAPVSASGRLSGRPPSGAGSTATAPPHAFLSGGTACDGGFAATIAPSHGPIARKPTTSNDIPSLPLADHFGCAGTLTRYCTRACSSDLVQAFAA